MGALKPQTLEHPSDYDRQGSKHDSGSSAGGVEGLKPGGHVTAALSFVGSSSSPPFSNSLFGDSGSGGGHDFPTFPETLSRLCIIIIINFKVQNCKTRVSSQDQRWRDANDAGSEPSLVLICSLRALQAPSAFREGDFSKVGKNQVDGRRLCKAGRPSCCSRLVVTDASGAYRYYLFVTVITYVLTWVKWMDHYAREKRKMPWGKLSNGNRYHLAGT
ncbi:uncharacterized protein N7473_005504 [Penicillium subrubescens]|uniref:Uncharacterized protein n=1 Tax=Penicillium subrubescens TaxID=1316194 RepID=A0A1Q5T663_9EURO|nr:uncharacterized protein N7473_005504 [Penicillium subrubescens]KAJ5896105.1 hypothetical protein N7473_005504 [Penicillium subrubescens]OKO95702.1 hypothetical protein PENSUB_11214 [Penicillium subrubescens]